MVLDVRQAWFTPAPCMAQDAVNAVAGALGGEGEVSLYVLKNQLSAIGELHKYRAALQHLSGGADRAGQHDMQARHLAPGPGERACEALFDSFANRVGEDEIDSADGDMHDSLSLMWLD
jgi:hypothetical protein